MEMENYMVSIGTGNGNCKVIRVDDNKLTCQPPKKEPGVEHSLKQKSGMPKIHVSISNSIYQNLLYNHDFFVFFKMLNKLVVSKPIK